MDFTTSHRCVLQSLCLGNLSLQHTRLADLPQVLSWHLHHQLQSQQRKCWPEVSCGPCLQGCSKCRSLSMDEHTLDCMCTTSSGSFASNKTLARAATRYTTCVVSLSVHVRLYIISSWQMPHISCSLRCMESGQLPSKYSHTHM